jgi:signal peptidase I
MIAALLIGLTIRFLWLQPFNIPSGAMQPTLRVHTLVLANKTVYGYGRFSFAPFETLVPPDRFLPRAPERGDVIVFRTMSDPSRDYVKRVIGLPGDRVQMLAGVLFLNGERVRRELLDGARYIDLNGAPIAASAHRETLPNGVSYVVLDRDPDGPFDTTETILVPAGRVFVLGDDRDNSQDSRAAEFGLVPIANLVGRIDALTPSAARQ